MTDHLLRSLAPISDAGWKTIDEEAKQRLTPALAARKLVDFSGPHGWEHSAMNLGRIAELPSSLHKGVTAAQRRVLSLAELRADFTVSRSELRDLDRGALDVDLDSLDDAAHRIAVAENVAVMHGWADAAITGIAEASPHEAKALGEDPSSYPRAIAGAVELLLRSGIGGPYGMAEHGGQLLLDHLRKILDGPIVWAPGVHGAVVLSRRGGDFILDCGEDLSIGYERHDEENVHLYIEESFAFVAATPDAAVAFTA